jgi:Rad3-related DNA helicase
MGTINRFTSSTKRYLLVASAEYGADFTWCDCQFILKVPYATLDDRMKALERKIGKSAFNNWYITDTINRMVQQCGRVGRGFDSFGCTFILDSKFSDVYLQHSGKFPEWFKERLVMDL